MGKTKNNSFTKVDKEYTERSSKYPQGDFYGTGVKQPVGSERGSNKSDAPQKATKKSPKSVV